MTPSNDIDGMAEIFAKQITRMREICRQPRPVSRSGTPVPDSTEAPAAADRVLSEGVERNPPYLSIFNSRNDRGSTVSMRQFLRTTARLLGRGIGYKLDEREQYKSIKEK